MPVVRVALPVAVPTPFDYWVPEGIAIGRGALVRVKLARRSLAGVVVEVLDRSDIPRERLQPVEATLPDLPALPSDLLEVGSFVASYYQEPLGLVIGQMIPPLRAARPAAAKRDEAIPVPSAFASPTAAAQVRLNDDQQRALREIPLGEHRFAPFLLQGVTGSGKTEVYLAAAAAAIAEGGQVLILVPEINLTPQLLQRIVDALPGRNAVMLHSRVAAGERLRHWKAAAAGEIDVVLGTRLAVFAPLPRLALIVVDEEHDPSFKQQEGVRYHGRDVAVWRARQREIPILLGSATPSLETLVQAQRGRYGWLTLPRRAAASAELPRITFVPNRDTHALEGMSPVLTEAIELRLEREEQSLVFINRRGFAPSLLCGACGWQAGCPRCSARLVVHRDARLLRCHHCAHAERLPLACPECGNVDLLPVGHGTQRLERALAARFPQARIARIDRDSTRRKGTFADLRDQVHAGAIDILVGTQMLAKGHDFPRLTLVGVLGADNALYSADFRATERLGALLFQVAGRAGRRERSGEVIVQTDFPNHPLARALASHDYASLADALLAERRAAMLPPFAHIALLVAEAPKRDAVDAFLAAASDAGRDAARRLAVDVEVYAPVSAALPRRAGLERGQVLAQASQRRAMQRFLPAWRSAIDSLPGRRVRFALDVDPLGFA
jgi:primosomal protein N' (replication factor Y)